MKGNVFEIPIEDQKNMIFEAVKESFAYQYENCNDYRRYCDASSFVPDDIKSVVDIKKIPLVTTDVFKTKDIYTGKSSEGMNRCLSSGTQGTRSVIYRDQSTLNKFIDSALLLIQMFNIHTNKPIKIFALTPTKEENNDLWIANTFSFVSEVFDVGFYVKKGEVLFPHLYNDLQDNVYNCLPVLVGPPVILLKFMKYLDENRKKLDLYESDGFVVTAGGWKKANDQVVEREIFVEQIVQKFNLKDQYHVRDIFNMVEMNTPLGNCSEGRYHIPPWMSMFAMSPEGKEVPEGKEGIMCFIDTSATSYPAYVMTDDFVKMYGYGKCKCGCVAPSFEYIRRINKVEDRGCAKKIDIEIEKEM